jgi:MinD superfamily P-loop ATPase
MPNVLEEICDGCGVCIDACSNDAITIENNKAFIINDLCLGCGVCIGSCPNGAIVPEVKEFKNRYIRPMPQRTRFYYQPYRPFINSYFQRTRTKRRMRRRMRTRI